MIKKILFLLTFLLFAFNAYASDTFLLMIAAEDFLYIENGLSYYIKAEFEVYAEKDGEILNFGPEVLISNPSDPDNMDTAFVMFPDIPKGSVVTIINTSEAYISDTVKIFVPMQISDAYDKEMEYFSDSTGVFSVGCSYYEDFKDWPWLHCISEMQISESGSITYDYDYTKIPYPASNKLTELIVISPELEYFPGLNKGAELNEETGNTVYDALYLEYLVRNTEKGNLLRDFFEENIFLFTVIIAVIAGILAGLASCFITLALTKNVKKPSKKQKTEKEPKSSKVKYSRKKWTIQDLIDIDRRGGRYY